MAAALALAVLLLANVVRRDDALGRARNAAGAGPDDVTAARTAAGAWPPDPDALGAYARLVDIETATGLRERAARIEPSGKRFYDLARLYAFQKRDADALDAFRQAAEAEPTRLQTLRALAETQEQAGDRAGALETWRRLAALHEGPVGRVRAIPELPEIHPAFAYAALADHAAARGDAPAALDLYGKAAAVVEDYADTTPVYQRLEVASALVQGMDLAGRRRELRALYERVQERSEALLRRQGGPEAAARIDALRRRRDATLGQLDRLLTRPDAG
jgi:tetratricopeptide (TPR) repeat protein